VRWKFVVSNDIGKQWTVQFQRNKRYSDWAVSPAMTLDGIDTQLREHDTRTQTNGDILAEMWH
jgi:hypothetical protein